MPRKEILLFKISIVAHMEKEFQSCNFVKFKLKSIECTTNNGCRHEHPYIGFSQTFSAKGQANGLYITEDKGSAQYFPA